MSATTTTYDILIKYTLQGDKATTGLKNIAQEADKAAKSVNHVGNAMRTLGSAVVGYLGFREATKHLIGYNAELQEAQMSMRSMIQLNKKNTFAEATADSLKLMGQFREDVKFVPGTVQDLAEFSNGISQAVFQAGGNMGQLRDLTTKGFVAAKSMFPNMPTEMASLEMTEALMGNLTKRNRFGRGLVQAQGMDSETFNKLDPAARLSMMMKALNDPAIKDAAKAYEKSWSGAVSTLKNSLQTFLGNVGLPLFQAISAEISKWNSWFEHNQDTLKSWAVDFANTLMQGFRLAKEAIGFLVEHKDLLLAIAKAWMVGKGIGAIAETGTAIGGMFKGLSGLGGGLAGMAKNVNLVSLALAAEYGVLSWLAGKNDKAHDQQINNDVAGNTHGYLLQRAISGTLTSGTFLKMMKQEGAVQNGNLTGVMYRNTAGLSSTPGAGTSAVVLPNGTEIAYDKYLKVMKDGGAAAAEEFSRKVKQNMDQFLPNWMGGRHFGPDFGGGLKYHGVFGPAMPDELKNQQKPQVNIGKLTITVESNDPDAFAIGMENYFKSWVKNPSSSHHSVREGR